LATEISWEESWDQILNLEFSGGSKQVMGAILGSRKNREKEINNEATER
jgi:hypothetical protein